MQLVPHSSPYLTNQDKESVLECFNKDYVGYDESVSISIKHKLSSYLTYTNIELTPSGSMSLLMILKYLKIKKHDEIILAAINCWSVYNTICMEGGTPILCDVRDKNDFRPSFETIINKVTDYTKVIIITHMYGVLIEEKIIQQLKEKYPNIYIIEDFSTSLFSKNNFKLGRYSDFGISSFGSTKPMTGGIGGLMCSNLNILNINYDKFNINELSFNLKLSRLNQALLLSQIRSYPKYQIIKKKLVLFYSKFINIYMDKSDDLFRVITFENPEKLINYLKKINIELDIRNSVQPNLIKELDIERKSNAFNFNVYYSIPLNIKAFNILNKQGLL